MIPEKSSYFSRRISKNYGMLKISGENSFWNICATILALLLGLLIFVQGFSDEIVAAGLLEEKYVDKLFVGYLLCGVIALFILVQTEIVFSSKTSEGNRKIEENELIDLYRKHILETAFAVCGKKTDPMPVSEHHDVFGKTTEKTEI